MRIKSLIIVSVVLLHSGLLFAEGPWRADSQYSQTLVSKRAAHAGQRSAQTERLRLVQRPLISPRAPAPRWEPRKFYAIHFENECDKTIWTAVYYLDFSGAWVTHGWWKLEPGQSAYVARTTNSIFYSYAHSDDPPDKRSYWKGDVYKDVRGETCGFRKFQIDGNFRTYAHQFTCD
jgi:hypothetical protein